MVWAVRILHTWALWTGSVNLVTAQEFCPVYYFIWAYTVVLHALTLTSRMFLCALACSHSSARGEVPLLQTSLPVPIPVQGEKCHSSRTVCLFPFQCKGRSATPPEQFACSHSSARGEVPLLQTSLHSTFNGFPSDISVEFLPVCKLTDGMIILIQFLCTRSTWIDNRFLVFFVSLYFITNIGLVH